MNLIDDQNAEDAVTVEPSETIQCGQTITGSVGSNPDSVSFIFENDQVQDVTFTDCDSNFDPKLFLMDSAGNYIQDQSTNYCDGDDCYDYSICSVARTETFTMEQLAVGTYTVLLTPWQSGGDYSLTAYCGEASTFRMLFSPQIMMCHAMSVLVTYFKIQVFNNTDFSGFCLRTWYNMFRSICFLGFIYSDRGSYGQFTGND